MVSFARILSPILSAGFLFTAAQYPLHAQATNAAPEISTLPNAPQPETDGTSGSQDRSAAETAATAIVSGTIVDTNGNVIQGARVAIRRNSGAEAHIVASGGNGQFEFSGLPPGPYKLTVTAPGMTAYASPQIDLKPGDVRILPEVALSLEATSTTITVSGDSHELSIEQEQIAVQQRVFGVVPNFFETYDWDAPPMQAKQKFQLTLRSTLDPTAFVVAAGVAGAEQYKNVFPAFGGGLEGYGKRYGAVFANHVTGQMFGHAIYPAIFHQDPRYFYKGKGSVKSRVFYALSAAVIARNDNGRWGPNYSNVLGDFSSAGLSNLYYPKDERGVHLVVFNGLSMLGSDAVENLVKEFILKDITSHIPRGANGER